MKSQIKQPRKQNSHLKSKETVSQIKLFYFIENYIHFKLEKKNEKEDPNEFFENRVLKGLPPELVDIPDLKPLAEFL